MLIGASEAESLLDGICAGCVCVHEDPRMRTQREECMGLLVPATAHGQSPKDIFDAIQLFE